jgi:hypothetical protein
VKDQAIQNIQLSLPVVDSVQKVSAVEGGEVSSAFSVTLLQKLLDQLLGTIGVLQIQNDFFYGFHSVTSYYDDTPQSAECEILISNYLPFFT